ncbi:MAG: OmpA family protein, partial [bacterium]|nr:OmpA family protein [bacterium]
VIEGYTDNIPIETPQFPSNWELSASRAAAVGRVLNGFGIATQSILVIGYAEQFPISDNFSEEGRTQNRRVNIVIAKERTTDRLFNPKLGQQTQTAIVGTMSTVPTEVAKQPMLIKKGVK